MQVRMSNVFAIDFAQHPTSMGDFDVAQFYCTSMWYSVTSRSTDAATLFGSTDSHVLHVPSSP